MATVYQKVTGKPVIVPDESVEFWRSLGYRDRDPNAAPVEPKKPATRRASTKK